MSTVQLQKALGVDRYNLYHHLKNWLPSTSLKTIETKAVHDGGERTFTLTFPNCSTPRPTCSNGTQHGCPEPTAPPEPPWPRWRSTKRGGKSSSWTLKVLETKSAPSSSSFAFRRIRLDPRRTVELHPRATRSLLQEEVIPWPRIERGIQGGPATALMSKCNGLLPSGLGELSAGCVKPGSAWTTRPTRKWKEEKLSCPECSKVLVAGVDDALPISSADL